MSIYDRILEEHSVLYKGHNVEQADAGHICIDCKLDAWSDGFPEYCIGPITEVDLGMFETNTDAYHLVASIVHNYDRALIEFKAGGVIDDDIVFDLVPEEIDDLISKLQKIRSQFKE